MKLPDHDHPITITPNPKRVRVSAGGAVIADTSHALTLKEASERAGHANISITADTYGHLLPRSDAAALAAAEGRFG